MHFDCASPVSGRQQVSPNIIRSQWEPRARYHESRNEEHAVRSRSIERHLPRPSLQTTLKNSSAVAILTPLAKVVHQMQSCCFCWLQLAVHHPSPPPEWRTWVSKGPHSFHAGCAWLVTCWVVQVIGGKHLALARCSSSGSTCSWYAYVSVGLTDALQHKLCLMVWTRQFAMQVSEPCCCLHNRSYSRDSDHDYR